MSRALKHIKSAVTEYGAHYGFVICFGYDRMIWSCTTANIFPNMLNQGETIPMWLRHLRNVYGYDANILGYRHLENIFGAGQKENAKQNTHGIRNKVESFARIAGKLAEEDPSGQYPVIVMLANKAKKHYIIHPDPQKYPEMAQIEAIIVNTMTVVEEKICTNYPPFDSDWTGDAGVGEPKICSTLHPGSSRAHLKRGVKRKASKVLPSTLIPARNADLGQGTSQWYQATARQAGYTLGKPLVHNASGYSWACSDARLSASDGRLLNVDKNMLVVVSSRNPETFQCTCGIFRHHRSCVHIEYARNNYVGLIDQQFHDGSDIFRVTKNDGKTLAGYCCDIALVRIISESKNRIRFKCDLHQANDCHHVRMVFRKVRSGKLFQDGRETDPDEESDEEEADPCQHLSKFDTWLETFGRSTCLKFPYEKDIKKAILERLVHGFADNVPGVKPLDVLMPATPEQCHCGLPYNPEDSLEQSDVTVYLRAPHCSRKIRCYSVRCKGRNDRCTIHYTGIRDGLWRVSRYAAVELDILVSAARDFVKQSGPSLQSIWETIQDRYLHYSTATNGGFIQSNTFRMGFFNVCKALNTYEGSINKVFEENLEMKPENCMLCPTCGDSPEVQIFDGTTMTLKKNLCHADAFTSVFDNSYKLWRRHNKNVRCYFSSGLEDMR